MSQELEPKHFDTRTMDRYVARGVVSTKERDKHLANLPDVAGKAEKTTAVQPDIEALIDD